MALGKFELCLLKSYLIMIILCPFCWLQYNIFLKSISLTICCTVSVWPEPNPPSCVHVYFSCVTDWKVPEAYLYCWCNFLWDSDRHCFMLRPHHKLMLQLVHRDEANFRLSLSVWMSQCIIFVCLSLTACGAVCVCSYQNYRQHHDRHHFAAVHVCLYRGAAV